MCDRQVICDVLLESLTLFETAYPCSAAPRGRTVSTKCLRLSIQGSNPGFDSWSRQGEQTPSILLNRCSAVSHGLHPWRAMLDLFSESSCRVFNLQSRQGETASSVLLSQHWRGLVGVRLVSCVLHALRSLPRSKKKKKKTLPIVLTACGIHTDPGK